MVVAYTVICVTQVGIFWKRQEAVTILRSEVSICRFVLRVSQNFVVYNIDKGKVKIFNPFH